MTYQASYDATIVRKNRDPFLIRRTLFSANPLSIHYIYNAKFVGKTYKQTVTAYGNSTHLLLRHPEMHTDKIYFTGTDKISNTSTTYDSKFGVPD